MWRLIIFCPERDTREVRVDKPLMTIGRTNANDIVLDDIAASRRHAELRYEPTNKTLIIRDLNSTNGTFVNHQRIQGERLLQPNDVIRIGQINITVVGETAEQNRPALSGTQALNREVLLEALDHHAILLYEVSKKLNTVLDIETALKEVAQLLKRAINADLCEIIEASQFDKLDAQQFPGCMIRQAILSMGVEMTPDLSAYPLCAASSPHTPESVRSAMCVPVMSGDEILAALVVARKGAVPRPFGQRELQLAIAISHQTALTIQRVILLKKVNAEQTMQRLLRRFLAPQEADYLLGDYLKSGVLPGLSEQKVTVLFSDIANSTLFAERLGVQAFAEILNNFYQDASESIFRFKGIVRYLGDGVMGVFVESPKEPYAEERAVKAGRELLQRAKHTGHLHKDLRIIVGVAINTGSAMIGYVGTEERAEFTVIGDTVNVAFRMQEFARPYRLVVGPATMGAIVGKFQTARIGEVTIKGRARPIQIYEVLAD